MKKTGRARCAVASHRAPEARRPVRRDMGRERSAGWSALLSVLLLGVFGVCGFSSVWAEQNGASSLAGDWAGSLKIGTVSLRIVFHVSAVATGYAATMDSPDQGARGIPVSAVRLEGRSVTFDVAAVGGRYRGTLGEGGESIEGTWSQSGMTFPLDLARQPVQPPQTSEQPSEQQSELTAGNEPSPPFPYVTREVSFGNDRAGVRLAGTLTIPEGKGPFPAVVLVSGSGPQNRDEEILGHRPFFVLADYLARRGIAGIRYDDRGVGGSTGTFQTATTFDFADDAQAALDFLAGQPEIDAHRLGVIGHSEGAIVASVLVARAAEKAASADVWRGENSQPAFIVLLAGPGMRGDALLLLQNAAIGRASGLSDEQILEANRLNRTLYSIAMSDGDVATLREKAFDVLMGALDSTPGLTEQEKNIYMAQAQAQADMLLSPWMRTFLTLDPSEYLKKVSVPVLALGGSKDLQVPAEENLGAIAAALKAAGNDAATLIELEELNHLFQHAGTGLPSEYGEIRETFAPEALQQIGDWILNVAAP